MCNRFVLQCLGVAALVVTLAPFAAADTVTLTNGNQLEGKARRVGDRVIIKTPGGEMSLEASEVRSIAKGETAFDVYAKKRGETSAKSADAQSGLADWCQAQGLRKEARRHWAAAIELEPDHAAARKALGFVRHDGEWLTGDELKEAQGLVKIRGKWIPREQARRAQGDKERKLRIKAHTKQIRASVRLMGSHKRATRLRGKVQLQEYAETVGDLKLAAWAADVAAFYNRSWRAYKTSLAKTEIRATNAVLKRPIPTFRTSLGAFTTPVTLQLPELSVTQIRTTALIPASEIELDEDG